MLQDAIIVQIVQLGCLIVKYTTILNKISFIDAGYLTFIPNSITKV